MFETQIRRGAQLLDMVEPGWRDRISVTELDMSKCSKCVVGHVIGANVLEVVGTGPIEAVDGETHDEYLIRQKSAEMYEAALIKWGQEVVEGGTRITRTDEVEIDDVLYGFCIRDLYREQGHPAEIRRERDRLWGILRDEWIGFIKGEWS
jgi:hypothetical protein